MLKALANGVERKQAWPLIPGSARALPGCFLAASRAVFWRPPGLFFGGLAGCFWRPRGPFLAPTSGSDGFPSGFSATLPWRDAPREQNESSARRQRRRTPPLAHRTTLSLSFVIVTPFGQGAGLGGLHSEASSCCICNMNLLPGHDSGGRGCGGLGTRGSSGFPECGRAGMLRAGWIWRRISGTGRA
jgi:hypothetical protein